MQLQTSSWTGNSAQDEQKLNVRPNAPFYLMHSAFQWEIVNSADDTWELLPQFSRLTEAAGINGVYEIPNGGVDSSHARLTAMDNGFTILDRELGYVARYASRFGGYHYTMLWDVPKTIGTRVFWRHDFDGYNDFRRLLITEGIIDLPEREVVDLMCNRIDRRIGRSLAMQHLPEIKTEIDRYHELKKSIRDAFDALHNPKKRAKK